MGRGSHPGVRCDVQMTERKIDVLIIGQGLAGTLLAWSLVQRGFTVCVVDDGFRTSSSRMAAGLLNPVTGLRFTRLKQADRFLAVAVPRYRQLESAWGVRFFHQKPQLRLFRDAAQQALWQRRRLQPEYVDYLGDILPEAVLPDAIRAPFGAGLQYHTAYLDTRCFLDAGRSWLERQGSLCQQRFHWSELQHSSQGCSWQGYSSRWVIACEGYRGKDNPRFPWLPMRPSKGQIVTLHTGKSIPEYILNGGRWLLPLGGGQVKVGATYERNALEAGPDPVATQQLLETARTFFRELPEWRLLGSEAGIRPGVQDKMPLAGLHPHEPQLGMFNGFGSKGVSMMPYYADALADHLYQGSPLPPEVSLQRWWNPYE